MGAQIHKLFEQADNAGDKDGMVSEDELVRVLRALSPWTDEEIHELFRQADKDKDGKLSKKEFVNWVFGFHPAFSLSAARVQEYKMAFEMFDADGSGRIGLDEVKQMLGELGWEETEAANLMQKCDENKDGKLSFD